MPKGAVAFLVLVAAFLLSTHYWSAYVTIHAAQFIIEIPKDIVRVAISAILLCASLYVILAPAYGPKDKHWAYGMVGTIVGFWVK